MGWLSDFFRLAWGLLSLNARKTAFRARGTRGRCPCQHVSDSGRAWETACDAVAEWNQPQRFRRLCPLLQRNQAGAWRCSVNREDVRPFWSRAVIFYFGAMLLAYLLLTFAVFGFLKNIGYGVTYPGVLWPPAWSSFTTIRADFFLQKYKAAAAAGDVQGAMMSLSTAYSLQPQNYAAGRQLAQFYQIANPGLSNQIYERLLRDHPGEAEATAQAWFRALLARGDFVGVQRLASERILAAPEPGAWINAFLFANRRTPDAATARRQLSSSAKLPATARFPLTFADELAQTASRVDRREQLLRAANLAPDGVSFFNVCRQLIAHGFAQETLQVIERRPGVLGPRDVLPLRLDALAALGWDSALQNEIENLLVGPPHAVTVELLSAHLIRYPDPRLREMLFTRIAKDPLAADSAGYSAYLAFFCACGVGRDAPRLQWTSARIRDILGEPFRGLEPVAAAMLDTGKIKRIENYLPALQPLPLEVSYALFDHYDPQQ